MSDERVRVEDLTDEQIEAVVNSRGFQKMLGYSRLAEGIDVLADEDEIFDSLVESIRKQHSNVNSEDSVREFFELFRSEVATFTEPLVDEAGDDVGASDLEDLYVEDGDRDE